MRLLRFLYLYTLPLLFVGLCGGVYVFFALFLTQGKTPTLASFQTMQTTPTQIASTQSAKEATAKRSDAATLPTSQASIKPRVESSAESISPLLSAPLASYEILVDILNIRTHPNTKSKISKRMYKHQILELQDLGNGWGKGKDGFVFLEFLQKIDG